jgi:hypothetical protein
MLQLLYEQNVSFGCAASRNFKSVYMQGKQDGGILGTNRRRNVVPKCIVSFF